ncbi:MAG: urease accessory protein UreE [Clostridiaceae bacterium]|nr:urease accessory protein UreE [Clostridiaceae bacterium]
MVSERILGNVRDYTGKKKIVSVPFEWFELEKKRMAKTAEDGKEIGISVGKMLHQGDVLAETESSIYAVRILPARQIKVLVHSRKEMGRLCFELGNRHLSLQIEEDEVRVPYDAPTFAYLKKLGFSAEEVTEAFTDFIVCKAHGNQHSHSHGHDHQHSHGHDHQHSHSHDHQHSHGPVHAE